MTIIHFQQDVASISKILKKNKSKFRMRKRADLTGKLQTEIRHLAQQNTFKDSDIQCLLA
jgi:hypothetical protein